jgi:hypothetical protein
VIGGSPRVPRRPALDRLATGLIAYGVLGLAIAALVLVGLAWLSSRIAGMTDGTGTQVLAIVDTLDETSTALTDASTSATSFSTTLERTPPAVRQAAQAIGDLRGNLRTIEAQLGEVSILGGRPFGGVAGQFGQMATDLEGLDTQLGLIADDLDTNRTALAANSTSLAALGDRLSGVADDLRGASVGAGLGEMRMLLTLLGLLLAVWVALPAGGALWLGWWLRREVALEPEVTP